jgi:hypothetical protein
MISAAWSNCLCAMAKGFSSSDISHSSIEVFVGSFWTVCPVFLAVYATLQIIYTSEYTTYLGASQ